MNYKKNKIFIAVFTILFVFNFVFLDAKIAKAQFVVFDPMVFSKMTVDTIKDGVEKVASRIEAITLKSIYKIGLNSLYSVVRGFATTLARDSANYLATGGKGSSSLLQNKPWDTYLKDAGKAAGAQFIDDLASGVGVDICKPPTVELSFDLALNFKTAEVTGNKPRCTFDEIGERWGEWGKTLIKSPTKLMQLSGQALEDFALSSGIRINNSTQKTDGSEMTDIEKAIREKEIRDALIAKSMELEESDLDFTIKAQQQLELEKEAEKELKTLEAQPTRELLPKTETIRGNIIVPGIYSEEKLRQIQEAANAQPNPSYNDLLVDTLNIFANTYISKKLESFLTTKLFKQDAPQTDSSIYETLVPSSNTSIKGIIQEVFTTINKININLNAKDVDVITELTMSDSDDFISKINYGTIDSQFAEVLQKSNQDPMSLQQAIEAGFINDNKFFGFINIDSNIQEPEVSNGISYNNMKKLRLNRIIPVGWELAALKIKEMGSSIGCAPSGCTLKDVMSGFNETGTFNVGATTIKDEYCGWRSIESYNYISSEDLSFTVGEDTCGPSYFEGINPSSITGLEFKNVLNSCYKYEVDDYGVVIDTPVDEISQYNTKEDCESSVRSDYFHKWVEGGCFVKEENESPFCKLVDPNWILKAPKQQCGASGYYSTLESSNSTDRYKDCADIKHCLKEDKNNNCLQYGYCLKEENIWRFRGDSCDERYANCRTLKDDEGKTQSYILDTLRDCDENEVGCKSYSIYQERDTVSSTYYWDETISTPITPDTKYKTVFLNKNSKNCDSSSNGCSKFLDIKPGTNIIPNSSFEIDEDSNNMPEGWGPFLSSTGLISGFTASTSASYDGRKSIFHTGLPADISTTQPLSVVNKGVFTLSYHVRKLGDGAATVTPKLIYNFGGESITTLLNSDADYSSVAGIEDSYWQRKSGYFSINNPLNNNIQSAKLTFSVSGDVYIDAVQLELNQFINSDKNSGIGEPSIYSNYGKNGSVYFKKAPEYYNCSTNPTDPNCSGFLKYCSASENGCEAYKPTNGDPIVPAIPTENDICPSECNGYNTFAQFSSYFENIEAIDEDPTTQIPIIEDKNFIASTAKDCPASEDSCELFTNIDKLELGGEAREYYSFIRQCVKPSEVSSSTTAIYYTWEGSDTSGFQLKTWRFLKSNLEDSDGGKAPCTNIRIGGTICNDMVETCDPATNFDCRTFYDKDGNSYDRLVSKTIPITDECVALRREASEEDVIYKAAPSLSRTCSSKNVGCRRYKGNNGNNTRNVFTEGFENGFVWDIPGASYSNEAIAYNGHSMKINFTTGNTAISYNLSDAGYTINPGKKYVLSFWAKSPSGCSISKSPSKTLSAVFENIKSIFYKDTEAAVDNSNVQYDEYGNVVPTTEDVDINFGAQAVTSSDWLIYKYDAVVAPGTINGEYILKFALSDGNSCGFYIDNIQLKEISSDLYKIKDSWVTPDICVTGDYLGCQEYKDRNKSSWYFYKFNDLCEEENVGCTAMIDTKNSDMPFKQTFNAYCKNESTGFLSCDYGEYYYRNYFSTSIDHRVTSTISVPKDELVYVVKNTKNICSSANKGCSKVGFLGADGNYSDQYKINNPDSYISDDYYGGTDETLCLSEYKDCAVFTKDDGSKIYKIHPRNLTCTYLNTDYVTGRTSGFYKTDSINDPNGPISCNGLLYNENYNELVNNVNAIDDDFKPYQDFSNQYAAICDRKANKCTEFIDPNDNRDMKDEILVLNGDNLQFNQSSNWYFSNWISEGCIASCGGNTTPIVTSGFSLNAAIGDPGIPDDPDDPDDSDFSTSISFTMTLTTANNSVAIFRPTSGYYNFPVKAGEIYSVSADVRFDGNITQTSVGEDLREYISTFLICKNSSNNPYYLNSSGVPYAFPSIKSNYYIREISGDTSWHNINGLYKILPEATNCNLAFYATGSLGSKINVKNIKFEKITGNYYYIDNDSIDRASCSRANQEEGCILFNNTSKKDLSYNSKRSYEEGRLIGNDPQYLNNTNELLSVVRDRQCSQWATCGTQAKTIENGVEKTICTSLVGCDEFSSDQSGQCESFVERGNETKPLTLSYYYDSIGRALWGDTNYSGYSIPGNYPIDSLSAFGTVEEIEGTTSTEYMYKLGYPIRTGNYEFKTGISLNPITSNPYLLADPKTEVVKTCRLYPEKDSPFTIRSNNKIATFEDPDESNKYAYIKDKTNFFQNANICQPESVVGIGQTCECSYKKVTYGSEILYFPYDYGDIPETIKFYEDVEIDGVSSTPTYIRKKKEEQFQGWRGFCLDYDSKYIGGDNRCMSWYPTDSVAGETDYQFAPEADVTYQKIPSGGKMCILGEDYTIPEDRVYCAYWSGPIVEYQARLYGTYNESTAENKCNVLVFVPQGTKISKNISTEFANYIMNSDNWIDPHDSDKLKIEEFTYNDKTYNIMYGANWKDWYEDNVYNDEYTCSAYRDGVNEGQEKELKFGGSDFNNYHINGSQSLIDDFKNLTFNTLVKFYFYDEGVLSNGATYNDGYDGSFNTYEWSPYPYSANVDCLDRNKTYIPLIGGDSRIAYERNDQSDGETQCGARSVSGEGYKRACQNYITSIDDVIVEPSVKPQGHEVFTVCMETDTAGGDSMHDDRLIIVAFNPKQFNYYVNYDFDNTSNYERTFKDYQSNRCEAHEDLPLSDDFIQSMNVQNSTSSLNLLKTCQIYADVSDSGDNRTIFDANNFYLQSIPINLFSASTTYDSACYLDGSCSAVKSGDINFYGNTVSIKYNNIHEGSGNWYSYSIQNPLTITGKEADRQPILHSGASFYDFSSNFSDYLGMGASDAGANMKNIILKIPSANFFFWSNTNQDWNDPATFLWNDPILSDPSTAAIQRVGEDKTMSDGVGFTVGNHYDKTNKIVQNASHFTADLNFYAFAAAASTPIRKIEICWDGISTNGTCLNSSLFTGPFKNRKPNCARRCGATYSAAFPGGYSGSPLSDCKVDKDCESGKCFSFSWGDTPEACIEEGDTENAYFSFSHIYMCSAGNNYWQDNCPDSSMSGGCCVYNPAVRITDNWDKTKTVNMCGDPTINDCKIIISPK